MTDESIAYSDIDLNLCWVINKEKSNEEDYIFSVLPSCDSTPTIMIENDNGKYQLQFKKEKSVIKLSDSKLWYDKTDLDTMKELS